MSQSKDSQPETPYSYDAVYEYLDVLERTSRSLESMVPYIEEQSNRDMLTRDAEVLLDLRARVWKQFTPVLVDVVN